MQNGKETKSISSLAKFIIENGYEKNGNGSDKRVLALLNSLARKPDNPRHKRLLWRIVGPEMVKRAFSDDPFMPYPAQDEIDGPIRLGKCGDMFFGLYPQELMEGTVIVGRPGSGKTTLCYHLIEQANAQGIFCLILDIKKDYRHIIRKISNTLVFRCEAALDLFKWNPLACPPSSLPDLTGWIATFSDITAEAHAVYDGAGNYISDHLYRLYKKFGVFEGSNNYPNLWDLYWEIKNDIQALVKRDARYKESALNRINSILIRMGKAFNCSTGYPIHELINEHNVVIEMDNLGTKGKIYMLALILAYVIFYRISNNLRGNLAKPVIVLIDEGNEVFDKALEKRLGSLTISGLTREAREFNLGVTCSCHLFQDLSDSTKNVHTRILMSVGEGNNLREAQMSMGISNDERDVNYKLNKGAAIVRKAERCTKAFPIQVMPYPIDKNVTNAEIKEHMNQFSSLLTFEMRQKEDKSAKEGLTSEQKAFLFDAYTRPYLSIKERMGSINL